MFHSHCNQILFKLLLNIVYNLFKIKKYSMSNLKYKYVCANMLHVDDIYISDLNLHLYHLFGKLTKKKMYEASMRNKKKDCNLQWSKTRLLKDNYC